MMHDLFWQRAIELALKGQGFTSPNPLVGALVVRNGNIVGEGFHKAYGKDHAEIAAFKSIKNKKLLKDAELFVTLEPCCHYGKTPPCVDKIIENEIKRVWVGMKDPFKKVNGEGLKILRKAGVEVKLLPANSKYSNVIRAINQPFIKAVKYDLPYVTLKSGITLDGKIATKTGDSHWVTSESSRNDARLERSFCDAVLIGANTAITDNPELLPLPRFRKKNFYKVVVDGNLNMKPEAKIFDSGKVLLFCSENVSDNKVKKFAAKEVEVVRMPGGAIGMRDLLKELRKFSVQSVFVEGGSDINGQFFDQNLIDRVVFYVSPKLLGGTGALSVIGGEGKNKMREALKIENQKVKFIGNELKIEGFTHFY